MNELLPPNSSEQVILRAKDFDLVDLDFPAQAQQFAELLRERLDASKADLILDLTECVVLYSSANEFLNVAIDSLSRSTAVSRRLEIQTSLDYVSEHITAYELFRGCKFLGDEVNSTNIVDRLKAYCVDHSLEVCVLVVSSFPPPNKLVNRFCYR